MTVFRLIAPDWLLALKPNTRKVCEGRFSNDTIKLYNDDGYNVYYLPNGPSEYTSGTVDGSQIDTFNWVFVDFDLKDGAYPTKDAFLEAVGAKALLPTKIIDSGNGLHVYWKVSDLDAMSFLRLSRRLLRLLNTDDTIATIYRLMRYPGTKNTKRQDVQPLCEVIYEEAAVVYACEELDSLLPPITVEDENYCRTHYENTYNADRQTASVSDKMPDKFGKLLVKSAEVKEIWVGGQADRSGGDYRLGHIMFASGFSRDEAATVLANSAKALTRAPIHRLSYAQNIVDKIWTFEAEPKTKQKLAYSVAEILSKGDDETLKGTRFPCFKYFDGTEHGFRLGQVIGLCAGVGVGKTAIALNIFRGFTTLNPDYIHVFVSLEQPGREIAARWVKMCGKDSTLHNKVHVLSNYNDDGTYRNLSLKDIQDYVLEFQKESGQKVGCVCIDHIGVLRKESKPGEFQGLSEVCAQMKSFAIATETLLIMQTQTNREKAGIGDLELSKDAAYGTQNFESYVDFMLVCWQPLKRCYGNPACPRVTALKFAKVRFKSKNDVLIEDECYRLLFDQDTETLRPLTQDEEVSFDYFASQALAQRKKDRKTDLVQYTSVKWSDDAKTSIKTASAQGDRQRPGRGDLN
jgi:hypothetical protein